MTNETEKRKNQKRNCLYCGNEFTPLRSTKKYCTGKCRSNHFTKKKNWDVRFTTIIVEQTTKLNLLKRIAELLRKARITYR